MKVDYREARYCSKSGELMEALIKKVVAETVRSGLILSQQDLMTGGAGEEVSFLQSCWKRPGGLSLSKGFLTEYAPHMLESIKVHPRPSHLLRQYLLGEFFSQ